MLNPRTRGRTGTRRGLKAGVLPLELHDDPEYKTAYDERKQAYRAFQTSVNKLKDFEQNIKQHNDVMSMDSAMRRGFEGDKLHDDKIEATNKEIEELKKNIPALHENFAEQHEKMRDIERKNNIPNYQRLARTSKTNPFTKGRMTGSFGIHNIKSSSHIGESDEMKSIKLLSHYTATGGRRNNKTNKRKRKSKRKTRKRNNKRNTKRKNKKNKKRKTKRR